jgi:hypothetical protein
MEQTNEIKDIKKVIDGLNSVTNHTSLKSELYAKMKHNLETAYNNTNSEEHKKFLLQLHNSFLSSDITIGKFNYTEAKKNKEAETPKNPAEETAATSNKLNEDKIMELLKGIKRSVSMNMYNALTALKSYQDDIATKDTLKNYPELKDIHDIRNNTNPKILMDITAKISNSTKHEPVKEVCKAIQKKVLEYMLYYELYKTFNHPESEYGRILATYNKYRQDILNNVSVLNKQSQIEAHKIIEKIETVMKLYTENNSKS